MVHFLIIDTNHTNFLPIDIKTEFFFSIICWSDIPPLLNQRLDQMNVSLDTCLSLFSSDCIISQKLQAKADKAQEEYEKAQRNLDTTSAQLEAKVIFIFIVYM